MTLTPDERIGWRFLTEVAGVSSDPPGFSRPSYSEKESEAHAIAERVGQELGLEISRDAAGNLYLELSGEEASACFIGSHLDTVPHGGNFDGAAGVAVGLAVLGGLKRSRRTPRRGVVVMAIRAEESAWFDASYIGSRAALGRLAAEELDSVVRSDSGQSLMAHLERAGFQPHVLASGASLLDRDRIAAYVEPHIEQGPLLQAAGAPVGLVTAIRGSFRYRHAKCVGRWDHSGATPRDYRRDAVAATARLVVDLDEKWQEFLANGEDLAVTVGQFSTDPSLHAFSKIGGSVEFSVDVRSTRTETLARFEAVFEAIVRRAEREYRVSFVLGPRSSSTPVALDESLLEESAKIANELGLPIVRLPSGAGHDCAVFADVGVPSAMVFMRSSGGSHNPEESLDERDFGVAARVVAGLVDTVIS